MDKREIKPDYTASFMTVSNSERVKRMKKRRRLRKPIRIAIRFLIYAAAAAVMDLMVLSTFLYWFGDYIWFFACGTSLFVNILLQYLFFKKELFSEK